MVSSIEEILPIIYEKYKEYKKTHNKYELSIICMHSNI